MHPLPQHTHQSHCCNPSHRRETEGGGQCSQSLPRFETESSYVPQAGGPGLYRKTSWASHGEQANMTGIYHRARLIKVNFMAVHRPDNNPNPSSSAPRFSPLPQSSSEPKRLGPRSAKQQIQGWRGRLGSREAGRQVRWRRRLVPKSPSAGPTGLAHFGWVATFLSNELFNCLIYLSRLGSADILHCLLIAWKVEQFFMF